MPETLIFLHIGKTAGTTFAEILGRNFPRSAMSDIYPGFGLTEKEFRGRAETERAALGCVRGHFDYGLHSAVPPPFAYVSFLRDPVEQVRSRFHHAQVSRWHPLHRMVRDGMGLAEFVSRSPDNYQARTLRGFELRPGRDHPTFTEADLERVKQSVENNFGALGLTERFDESLLLIRRRFELRTIDYVRRNVRRVQRPELTAEEREALEASTRFDRELYAWASDRLDAAIAEAGSGFEQELDEHRASLERFTRRARWLEPVAKPIRRLDRGLRTFKNKLRRRFS